MCSIRNIRPQYLINESAVYCLLPAACTGQNLADIAVAYKSGWSKYTEIFYSTEWPEAELIAPLLNDGAYFPGI
jgi:hypothetical protein